MMTEVKCKFPWTTGLDINYVYEFLRGACNEECRVIVVCDRIESDGEMYRLRNFEFTYPSDATAFKLKFGEYVFA